MEIYEFFYEYFDIPDLQWILEEKLGFSITGNKSELVDRIVDNERFHPKKLLKWLELSDLRKICKKMRLKVSGNKTFLWNQILVETKEFDLKYGNLTKTNNKILSNRPKPILNTQNRQVIDSMREHWVGIATVIGATFTVLSFFLIFLTSL